MSTDESSGDQPAALSLLASKRPRNLGTLGAAGLLFGDWGTSRLYVLGLAFLVAGRTSFYIIAAMSLLILAVAWAYTQICRIYPDGGGVYTAARHRHPLLGVVGALLLFADYTITASLSAVEAFHYFGLGEHSTTQVVEADAGHDIRLGSRAVPAEKIEDSPTTQKVVITEPATQPTAAPTTAPTGTTAPATLPAMSSVPLTPPATGPPVMSAPATSPPATQPEPLVFTPEPGENVVVEHSLWHWNSPGLWGIIAILLIGALNLLGPKHTAGPAVFAAIGMIIITLLVTVFALPQLDWSNISLGSLNQQPLDMWQAFVAVVLALSGVEAIANLTGVMKKPVSRTAARSIWLVAAEVAVFNLLLALIMVATSGLGREAHKEDMLAFMAGHYIGPWGEWPVRIIGGVLLLSATNTAIGALMSTLYVMSRDAELPRVLQKLNGFGAPWIGGIIAAAAPAIVLLFFHDLEKLAHLYAIGIVGAVAINCLLTAFHPRLRKKWRKVAMLTLALLLIGVWITLAFTKVHALIFVSVVMVVGLAARQLTRFASNRRPKMSLLRQAIIEQLTPDALVKPKLMLSTAGSSRLAEPALAMAQAQDAALVVSYIREVALSYKVESETQLTLDTDPAAQALFTRFLELGHEYGVPIVPMYDTGTSAAELIAETAAINGVSRVLIGSSRRGALHQFIKGSFQRRLEALLPPDIQVQVLSEQESPSAKTDKVTDA